MYSERLAGRVAMVTGAADGIGEAMARRFASEGAVVVVADYDAERGPVIAESIRSLGQQAVFQHCDVTDKTVVTAAVAAAIAQFGALDILVNNAYHGDGQGRIESQTDLEFESNMAINLYAAKWTMEAAFRSMRARNWGRIINVASLNGVNAHMGTAAYNASKEALRAYTRTAAREWARHGICANIICPGAATANYRRFREAEPALAAALAAANPMGRIGDPEQDIAPVALFLASEDARYLTGNTLFVGGGSHINGVAWTPDLGPDVP
jgi:NAD(P)-dependent dehydrogenase (short-subunit alcohol dehydrogenase family)